MRLVLREEALDDLSSIYEWYRLRNPAIARAIMAKVRARLAHLETFPEIGEQADGRDDRVLIVTGTPLLAVYRIDVGAGLIDVVSIIDARRHPATRFRS